MKTQRTFHYARVKKSPRLKRVLRYLAACGRAGATTLDITHNAVTTRASSDLSELAANGINHVCRHEFTTQFGARVHRFWLAQFAPNDKLSDRHASNP